MGYQDMLAKTSVTVCIALAAVLSQTGGIRAESSADLAKKLTNPIANMISLPIQTNYDFRIGPGRDGSRQTFNIQPVIPISLGNDWLIISRTIMPVVNQNDIFPGAGHNAAHRNR